MKAVKMSQLFKNSSIYIFIPENKKKENNEFPSNPHGFKPEDVIF